MIQKQYKLSYLPIFYSDLLEAVNYIMLKLKNEQATEELLNLTEMAILSDICQKFYCVLCGYPRYK